jgi:MSHA biogenesis protein MshO
MRGVYSFEPPSQSRIREAGFTLAEAIIVIVITGILAGIVAVFIRSPVQGFFDTARRAALADAADTALRRIGRDLRQALPNSVRVSGSTALEFLHVRSAGRYCEQGPPCNPLDFTAADTSFEVLGPGVEVLSGDSVVVYNLGVSGADAYEGTSTSRRAAAAPFGPALTTVTIGSGVRFPFASPGRRFQVVDTPVSYICSGNQILRYWGYTIVPAQPVPPAGGTNALIADKDVPGGCNFSYEVGASQRDALVSLRLALTDGGETVSLLHQVHVNNAP